MKNCSRFFNNPIASSSSSHHPSINFFPLHFTSAHLLCLTLCLTLSHSLSLNLYLTHFSKHTRTIKSCYFSLPLLSLSLSLFVFLTLSLSLLISFPFLPLYIHISLSHSFILSPKNNLESKFALALPPAQLFS